MKKTLLVVAIFVLLFGVIASAFQMPEPKGGITTKKVSGVVCTIPKGEYVTSTLMDAISFEDQYVNVLEIWSHEDFPEDVIAFRLIGFKHDCPIHGLEVIELDTAGFAELKPENCQGLEVR